jgi:hypothetical protein
MYKNRELNYIYSHISDIEERIETIRENLKWITSDIKFIKKLSKSSSKEEK